MYRYGKGHAATFIQYLGGYDSWLNFGLLWFVAALLAFTFSYLAVKPEVDNTGRQVKLPGTNIILLFAFALGVISFLIRIVFPVGWVLEPLGFQLAHFKQSIAFCIGRCCIT